MKICRCLNHFWNAQLCNINSLACHPSVTGPLLCKASFGEPNAHLLLAAADTNPNLCILCMQDDYTGYKTYAQNFFLHHGGFSN